ncbi:unnamed protein product, partial [Pylaiella littoralis]
MAMRTGAAGRVTGLNSYGVSGVCRWESPSGGESERWQQQRFSPPKSRVHALVDSGTGHVHAVSLTWYGVVLLGNLHVRICYCDRWSAVVVPVLNLEGTWAHDWR